MKNISEAQAAAGNIKVKFREGTDNAGKSGTITDREGSPRRPASTTHAVVYTVKISGGSVVVPGCDLDIVS